MLYFAKFMTFIFLPIVVVGGITTPAAPSPITVEPYSSGSDFPRPIDDTEHLNSEISFVYAG